MKIVVTGASGHIGKNLVSYLLKLGHQILVVGRDPDALADRFPTCSVSNYDELGNKLSGCEAMIHLAVMNNDTKNSLGMFREANLGLLQQIFETSRQHNVRKFIYLSSFQISDPKTPYAISKFDADNWLSKQTAMQVSIIRIPATYSNQFRGKLSILNFLPAEVSRLALHGIRAAKPIVAIDLVIEGIVLCLNSEANQSMFISDAIEENFIYKLWRITLDWAFILSAAFLFSWLFLIIWVLVKLSSQGPAIFAQQRIGYRKRTFTCYKFRTMEIGTKEVGTHDVDASAVTPIGAFLRRTKIDELPQIWNIAKGEVTLIGPRPSLPSQSELVDERTKRGVFAIKPGITGLAQIQGIDMKEPILLSQVDQSYFKNRNIILDISILFRTFTGQGMRDGIAPKI